MCVNQFIEKTSLFYERENWVCSVTGDQAIMNVMNTKEYHAIIRNLEFKITICSN